MSAIESPLMKAEDGNVVQVFLDTRKNEYASETEGRPIFDKCLMVRVISPGSRQTEVIHEAKRIDWRNVEHVQRHIVERFRKFIDAFESGQQSPELQGTPLDAWPRLDVRQIAELRAQNVHTLEALASVPDGHLGGLGLNGRELRESAKRFLAAAAGEAPMAKLEKENTSLKERIDVLEATVKALQEGSADEKSSKRGKAA